MRASPEETKEPITVRTILRRLGIEHLPHAVQDEEIRRWASGHFVSPGLRAALSEAGYLLEPGDDAPADPDGDGIDGVRAKAARARSLGAELHMLTCSDGGVHLICTVNQRLVVVSGSGLAIVDSDPAGVDPRALPLLVAVHEQASCLVGLWDVSEQGIEELAGALGCRVVVRDREFTPVEMAAAAGRPTA